MARHDDLDAGLLQRLAGHAGTPVVTIVLPTHRWGPEVAQDRVLLLDTIEETARMAEHRAWTDFEAALASLRHEASLVDTQHLRDGLVLYAGATFSGHLAVEVPVVPRVSVGTRVALGVAVQALQARLPALVVGLTDHGARAWSKRGLILVEVQDDHFPFELGPDNHRGHGGWDFGRQRTALDTTRRDDVVHAVDQRLGAALDGRPVPAFVTGDPKLSARLHEVSRADLRSLSPRLGALEHASPAELAAVARRLDEALRSDQEQRRVTQVCAARGAHRLASDLDEITELVHEGNASSLLLDARLLASVDLPRASRLDHALATMLARSDDVGVVEPSTLGDDGPHVLITRY